MTEPYYADEYVTLYHGDCLELADLWTCADVLVTDPPYGVQWESHHGDRRNTQRKATRTPNVLAGDSSPAARDDALAVWGDRASITFGSWRVPRPISTRALLVWNKDGCYSALSRNPFFTVHEEMYVMGDGWSLDPSLLPLRSVLTTTEHRSKHTGSVGHPTPKPLSLMRQLIERCPPGTIADPFAGSGSTLVAAKQLGRKAIGIELDERYCEIAAKRLAQGVLDFGVRQKEARGGR